MSEKVPMTPGCQVWMKEQVRRLKNVERPAVAKDIEIARGHGDLSENADYDAAKERQGLIEARIRNFETKLALADVIDPTALSGDRVMFGATVKIENVETGEIKTYTIVGEDEADIKKGRLYVKAPLARALIGKYVGDETSMKGKEYEILEVQWLEVPPRTDNISV